MNTIKALPTFRRSDILNEMTTSELDVFVIGGGITGAGIALDAATRGLKIGLVDKQDFGAGTSSRSTKLIHGGLRYLKQGEINLVREVGREREILFRNAPHIVTPEKMLLPLVENGTYGKFATSIGLWIYDWLAGVKREEKRVMLSKQETRKREPLLRSDILKGGGLYSEYRTDDARLTVEVIKTAVSFGARCTNYTELTEFIYHDKKIVGANVVDLLNGKSYQILAKKIINAAGPWVDQLRSKDQSLYGKRLHHTKGVHLVVPYSRLPLRQSIYFDVPGGRMIFAIPRDDTTYIGTTDTDYSESLEKPVVTKEDVQYLLTAVNDMFPTVHLTREDIASSWAGLRPLIHEDGKSASELSRKDEIIVSPTGLITIAGGKLTGFRKMAERVVDLTLKKLVEETGITFTSCKTDSIILSGGKFVTPNGILQYIDEQFRTVKDLGITKIQLTALVRKYGTNTEKIIRNIKELQNSKRAMNNKPYDQRYSFLVGELMYGIEEEMVASLSDFLIRRSGRLFFGRDELEWLYPRLADEMASMLGWSKEDKERHLQQFKEEYEAAIRFE